MIKFNIKSNVILHPALKELLSYIDVYAGEKDILITDAERSIKQHIDIYKKLELENKLDGKKWYEAIPWESDHLPSWNKSFLECVDFTIDKLSGEMLKKLVLSARNNMVIKVGLGIGVGSNFIHVSLRKEDTFWNYSY